MDHKETDFTKEIASYLHVYMPAIYVFTCQLFTCLHANYLHVYMPTVVTRSFKKEKKKKKSCSSLSLLTRNFSESIERLDVAAVPLTVYVRSILARLI